MFAQGHNCKLSVSRFNGRADRRGANASLKVLNGRVALVVGCIALCLLVATLSASAQDISVRLVNAKSGKPLCRIRVAMSTWNGTFDIHRPPLPHRETVEAITDAKGVAVFHLPQPIPERVGFEIGGLRDFAGCWRLRDLSPATVLRSGVVADYNESKCGKLRTQASAKPGEVVIVDKKLTLGDQMRQELP
jgi:hypothetical protein